MQDKTWIWVGIAGLIVIVLVYATRQSTTSTALDPGSVQNANDILTANANALQVGSTERTAALTLAEDYAKAHDANQTALTQAWLSGASSLQLAAIAEDATLKSKSMDDTLALQEANVGAVSSVDIARTTTAAATVSATQQANAAVQAAQAQGQAAVAVADAQKPSIFQQIGSFLTGLASVALPFLSPASSAVSSATALKTSGAAH